MKKSEVLRQMQEIVEKTVKSYKTDFYKYDKPQIESSDADKYIFIVRKTGTWLIDLAEVVGGVSEVYEYCYSSNVHALQEGRKRPHKIYKVDLRAGTVKQIKKDIKLSDVKF